MNESLEDELRRISNEIVKDRDVREAQRDAINSRMWRDDVTGDDLRVAIRWLTQSGTSV